MATSLRTYLVIPKVIPEGTKFEDVARLVKCAHPNTARSHVSDSLFNVGVASQDDLERLLPKGVKVEKIGVEQGSLPT